MNRLALGIATLLFACAGAWAQESDSASAAPATRPSLVVAIAPLQTLADSRRAWVGKAVQDGLASGISNGAMRSISLTTPADDTAAALSAAKAAGAQDVIVGNVQVADEQVRIAARILQTSDGQSAGDLKIQGSLRDLFNLEDALASKASRLLIPHPAQRSSTPLTIPMRGPAAVYQSTYFDGDVMAQLKPPEKFTDQYNRYYYQSCEGWCGGYGCGFGCSYGLGCGGPSVPFPQCPTGACRAYPVSTW